MKLASFCIITLLSLIFAGLTLVETGMYQTWDGMLTEQRQIQAKIASFQRTRGFAEQLLRRIAIESQRDPALVEVLKQHQIKVVLPVEQTKETPAAAAAPGAPDKPTSTPPGSTPPGSTPSHP